MRSASPCAIRRLRTRQSPVRHGSLFNCFAIDPTSAHADRSRTPAVPVVAVGHRSGARGRVAATHRRPRGEDRTAGLHRRSARGLAHGGEDASGSRSAARGCAGAGLYQWRAHTAHCSTCKSAIRGDLGAGARRRRARSVRRGRRCRARRSAVRSVGRIRAVREQAMVAWLEFLAR